MMAGKTYVPISEYPYYYRCSFCTGAAFFLKENALTNDKCEAKDAIDRDGNLISPGDEIRCYVCENNIGPLKKQNIHERPDPIGVRDV